MSTQNRGMGTVCQAVLLVCGMVFLAPALCASYDCGGKDCGGVPGRSLTGTQPGGYSQFTFFNSGGGASVQACIWSANGLAGVHKTNLGGSYNGMLFIDNQENWVGYRYNPTQTSSQDANGNFHVYAADCASKLVGAHVWLLNGRKYQGSYLRGGGVCQEVPAQGCYPCSTGLAWSDTSHIVGGTYSHKTPNVVDALYGKFPDNNPLGVSSQFDGVGACIN